MAYRLNHLYISPPAPLLRGENLYQPASFADAKLETSDHGHFECSHYSRCSSSGGGRSFEFFPESWRCSFSGGPSPAIDMGTFQGQQVLSASVHCSENLWDTANSGGVWDHPGCLQQNYQAFPAAAPTATAFPAGYFESYPSDADLGAQEDRFSYLEARSVSVVGRQLAVRVYREAQLQEFFMQQQVSLWGL